MSRRRSTTRSAPTSSPAISPSASAVTCPRSASPARTVCRRGPGRTPTRSPAAERWASAFGTRGWAAPATRRKTVCRRSPATQRRSPANSAAPRGRGALAKNGDPVAEDLLDARQQIVAGGDLVVVPQRQDRLAAHWDLHPQDRPAAAGVGAQHLLQRAQLILADQIGVELDVEQRALLGPHAGQWLGVEKTQPLTRRFTFPKGGVDGAGHEDRFVLGENLAVLVDLLGADEELDLAGLILQREVGDLAGAALHRALGVDGDHAGQDDLGALTLLGAVGGGRVGEAADLAGVAIERVSTDVEAERLLFVGEQLLRHPLVEGRVLVLTRRGARALRAAASREKRQQVRLPALPIALRLGRTLAGEANGAEDPRPRDAVLLGDAVEGARLH